MKYFFLAIFTGIACISFGQNEKQMQVKSALENYGQNYLQEKIYAQFDKPLYSPGETIWFKAYILAGVNPSDISKNVYIDFSDAAGNILQHGVAPVFGSTASGQFDLPANYPSKLLHVRIYTSWMLNFDSTSLFNKDLAVLQINKQSVKKNIENKISVRVFPEGGNFIKDIATKIAFKAVWTDGTPAKIQGYVQDNAGKKIADIQTIHDGMGYFILKPLANENYSLSWKDDKGNSGRENLPAVQEKGLGLSVTISPGKRDFIISGNENATGNFSKAHIVAIMAQQLVYMAGVNLASEKSVTGSIPTAQLPSGILQVTVFDSNWVAIAERITFINNDNYSLEPEVGFSVLGNLTRRGKNTLVINLPIDIEANYSVSVTDAGVGADSSDNIITHFLVSSELRGKIYQPYYYFTDNSDSLQAQLDLVMLSNGWRKINWESIVQGKMPDIKYPKDTSYLTLQGKVFGIGPQNYRNGMALLMILVKKDSSRQLLQLPLHKDGSFDDAGTLLVDTSKMYYQVAGNAALTGTTAITAGIKMLPAPIHIWNNAAFSTYDFTDTSAENRAKYFALEEEKIKKYLEGNVLKGVTIVTRIKTPEEKLDDAYTSGLFTGGEAITFDVLDDKSAGITANLLSYLTGRVPGMSIINRNDLNGGSSVTWRGASPTFYLNENQIDVSQVNTIDMNNVAYIKIFRPPFIGDFSGGEGGAVVIYTKKGADALAGNDEKKGLPYKIITGYTAEKEFYSPDYGSLDFYDEKADIRSTLYWNPNIEITSDNHIQKFTFYNNDISHSYRIVLEGFTKDGKLAHVEKVVE
ncbi:MAG: hypothetical protein WAU24_10665 [Chitinophagaceae bacterium]